MPVDNDFIVFLLYLLFLAVLSFHSCFLRTFHYLTNNDCFGNDGVFNKHFDIQFSGTSADFNTRGRMSNSLSIGSAANNVGSLVQSRYFVLVHHHCFCATSEMISLSTPKEMVPTPLTICGATTNLNLGFSNDFLHGQYQSYGYFQISDPKSYLQSAVVAGQAASLSLHLAG